MKYNEINALWNTNLIMANLLAVLPSIEHSGVKASEINFQFS